MATDAVQLKLLTIGDSGVGKSWLLMRWAGEVNRLKATIPTIGIDFKIKHLEINGKKVKVQIWDTAGQERYRTITTTYYRNSHGILMVYDITDRRSFNNVRNWMTQIQLNADLNVNKILIGNKCDLVQKREVTYEEGEAMAKEFKITFVETSAVNDINVDEAFMRITRDVYQRMERGEISLNQNRGGNSSAVKYHQKSFSSADFVDPSKATSEKKGCC